MIETLELWEWGILFNPITIPRLMRIERMVIVIVLALIQVSQ